MISSVGMRMRMSWYAYSTRIYVNMCRVVEEYLVVVVFEGAEAAHDVLVGLHHLKDVARIRKLGGASRMFDAAAHARHRVGQCLALLCKHDAFPRTRLLDLARELYIAFAQRVSVAKCEEICDVCAITAPGSSTSSSCLRRAMWCSSVR